MYHSPQQVCVAVTYTYVRGEGGALRCLTSAVQHGSGYGNAPTRRGGGDHEQIQKRGWGAKQHVIAPKLHKRPHCRRAEHVWSEYIGMGREWEENLVLIRVSTLQLAS